MAYRHTQTGWAMLLILGGIIVFLGWVASRSSGLASVVVLAVLAVLTICLLLFISQTVIVDDERVELRMGPGLIRRRYRWTRSRPWTRCGCRGGGRLWHPDGQT